MPISVNLTAGPKITVMSDGGRVMKVLSQRTVQFKIVSAGPQGISAFGVWQAENPGGSYEDFMTAITGKDGGPASISADSGNSIKLGSDGKMFASPLQISTTDWIE